MTTPNGATPSLKTLIGRGKIIAAPGAYNALSAIIAEQAGFEAVYLTGNGQASSMLGLPDVGLITLTEMAERVRAIRSVTTVPLIADADVGYGSLLNVRRAIRELEAAGASAIQLEDQVSPKKCGHELGRNIVSVEEMQQRLFAATDGRQNPNTLIIARTDARTTHGLGEAIRRGHAYAKAGADIIFVESPESEDELREVATSLSVPTLANMVEAGHPIFRRSVSASLASRLRSIRLSLSSPRPTQSAPSCSSSSSMAGWKTCRARPRSRSITKSSASRPSPTWKPG